MVQGRPGLEIGRFLITILTVTREGVPNDSREALVGVSGSLGRRLTVSSEGLPSVSHEALVGITEPLGRPRCLPSV